MGLKIAIFLLMTRKNLTNVYYDIIIKYFQCIKTVIIDTERIKIDREEIKLFSVKLLLIISFNNFQDVFPSLMQIDSKLFKVSVLAA